MTGYEFTRFDANFTSTLKAHKYNIEEVKSRIEHSSNLDFRKNSKYEDAKNWFIETTMSCDEDEAKNWMKHYMLNAIAYGIQTKDKDWKFFFLAAYDIFRDL